MRTGENPEPAGSFCVARQSASHDKRAVILHNLLAVFLLICASQQAHAQVPKLTEAEKNDIRYVLQKGRNGAATPLDLSDPRQNRFLKKQFALAGRTPRLNPELFRSLQRALRRGRQALAVTTGTVPTGPQPVDMITDIKTDNQQSFITNAMSSVQGGTSVTMLTLGLYDANENPIGPVGTITKYGGGQDVRVSAQGAFPNPPASTGQLVQAIGTYFYEKNGIQYGGDFVATSNAVPISITNNAPKLMVAGHTQIYICLNRGGAYEQDCDYACSRGWNCTNTPNAGLNAIFPVSGEVVFPGPIAPIQYDQEGIPTNAFSRITIAWQVAGGGCNQQEQTNFFKDPNTIINGNTLTWNLNPAQFGLACYQASAPILYSFAVWVTVNGQPVYAYINNTGSTKAQSTLPIPATNMVIGCLAEGTYIRLADGTERQIEFFDGAERVVSNPQGKILSVRDTLVGVERKPLIRIKTDQGHSLLLTDAHPVVTTKGIRIARRLRIGDIVFTPKGQAKIVFIAEEMFAAQVWNLIVGRPEDNIIPNPENTTFFANGILVGDAQMQDYWDTMDRQPTQSVLQRLPKRWRQDYLNSLAQQRGKNR